MQTPCSRGTQETQLSNPQTICDCSKCSLLSVPFSNWWVANFPIRPLSAIERGAVQKEHSDWLGCTNHSIRVSRNPGRNEQSGGAFVKTFSLQMRPIRRRDGRVNVDGSLLFSGHFCGTIYIPAPTPRPARQMLSHAPGLGTGSV